ncbi:MAG: hypothetical protein WA516_13705 [Candidatus Acidiferrales bacterium]
MEGATTLGLATTQTYCPQDATTIFDSEKELEPRAERIRSITCEAETTFVITNNHYQGKGVVNALKLISLLTSSKVKIPESLRQHYPELEKIASEPPQEPSLFNR